MSIQRTEKNKHRPLLLAIGAGLALSVASIPIANASVNPFSADKLSSGYSLAGHATDKAENGKCGTGKCSGEKKAKEGKCGAGKCSAEKKAKEGKCGADKADKGKATDEK